MTGLTTPDGLRYPNDYEQPADSPNAFQQLAADVQTALNNHMDAAPSAVLVTPASGWSNALTSGYGQPTVRKSGRLVIGMGLMNRTSTLTIADNGIYPVGTIPAGYRPTNALRMPCAWYANNGSTPQFMTTQLFIEADGTVSVVSNVTGSMPAGRWVSFSGISWVTP